MIKFHYAMQICDTANRDQTNKRFCGDDRALLTKKSVKSFLESISYLYNKQSGTEHHILFLADNTTDSTLNFIERLKEQYQKKEINIYIQRTELGCKESMRTCFDWLSVNGKDLIYLVQDDYLFLKSAVYEMASIFFQLHNEVNAQPIVMSFNAPSLWRESYRNNPTPRAIFVGENRYWIQSYDTPSTFLTSREQLSKNWDVIQLFLQLSFYDQDLEKKSLNKMFTQKGILGVLPINSVALHMQGNRELDPYINWKEWWDSIDVEHEKKPFTLPEGKIVLNVGGGGISCKTQADELKEYTELFVDLNEKSNPDILASMLDLSVLPPNSVDCVYSSHSLEHIYFHEIPKCLSEWYRVIKDGGKIIIQTPNLKVPAQLTVEGKLLDKIYDSPGGAVSAIDMFYGHKDLVARNEYMAHKTGFTKESMEIILTSLNYTKFKVIENDTNLDTVIYK